MGCKARFFQSGFFHISVKFVNEAATAKSSDFFITCDRGTAVPTTREVFLAATREATAGGDEAFGGRSREPAAHTLPAVSPIVVIKLTGRRK